MWSDMGGITGSIFLLCLISLANANTSPVILVRLYQVCEDTPRGAFAFTINATDADNDALTYSLTDPGRQYFSVNRDTGDVSVAQALDRETMTDVITLGVEVSDGPNTTPAVLTIILLDANDNIPIFERSTYDLQIRENTAVGTSLFRVSATDDDTSIAGSVAYKIVEAIPSDGLRLFTVVNTTGEVRLEGSLNYTTNSLYRLNISATDGGGQCHPSNPHVVLTSFALSLISVLDVPDLDPQFIGLPYGASVEENSPVDQVVFKVSAIDPDVQVNDKMIYSIEGSTADGLFKISQNDGVISVASVIDREVVKDTVTLTVKATESQPNIHGDPASTTAAVVINIIDVNDNAPEFYKCDSSGVCVTATQFTGEVFEHSSVSIPIDMTVKDPDKSPVTQLELEGEDKNVFSVSMTDGVVQLLVRQPLALDYEKKQQMILQVIAIDAGEPTFRSTATVTINIKDTNDNSPRFPEETYRLTVNEHSPDGTVVADIVAEDPDTMDQDKLTYRLRPDSILQYFDVKPQTGEIYVKNQALLDREVRSLYSATLQATDTDNSTGSTVLEITLLDINDQPPVFNRASYQEFVEEGRQLEVRIEATDADDPDTANSQIVYGIVPSQYSGNFTINPDTGVLRNNGELDREALDPDLDGRIELTVTATDKGSPPLSSTAKVVIDVLDVDDNAPRFTSPSYNFSVKEGVKGAFVGSVHAVDLDQTLEFNRITFSITDGLFGSFIIRSFKDTVGYIGNITVDPGIELDHEGDRKTFNLVVEAVDLEQNKAEVKVEVHVEDVNDERPEFLPSEVIATVDENYGGSEPVGRFTAYDKDGNHSLVYELVSVNCICKSNETACNWFTVDPSGEVKVNPAAKLDYEDCQQAVVEAQVVDEYTEKGENNSAATGKMVINIRDVNDNAPEFLSTDSVFVVVSEGASVGAEIAQVTATDADSGVNREITFRVSSVQFENKDNVTTDMRSPFEAKTTQQKDLYVAFIQATEQLDMTLQGKYLVTVVATDDGGLSSSIVLEIFTIDQSFKVELEFSTPEAEVRAELDEIKRVLTTATRATVQIFSIGPPPEETTRAPVETMIVAYFVYTNGTALTSDEVETMLADPEHYPVLVELGLENIGGQLPEDPPVKTLEYVLLGLVGGLIIVLAVLTTSLLCTRRNYRTKLRAAKAMNSASMVHSDNPKSGPVVPGTNKYTMEGANPVLNLNIDTALVLGLDEESSDVDKVSLNSLDYNDDMIMPERDTKSTMHMIQEEEEDGPPEYIEPLGAALAQRGQKKSSDHPGGGYDNPAFNTTTDL